MLAPLLALDAADFDTGLSPSNARAAWNEALALAAMADTTRSLPGRPPGAVAIIASANVFTAPLEWAYQLAARGVRVVLKAASAQGKAASALALLPGVEVREWLGGHDVEAESRALGEVDAVVAFGAATTLDALRRRSPVPVLGFGPRFGVAFAPELSPGDPARIARDVARFDSRGCMSPAALFTRRADLHGLAAAMAEAEAAWPRGTVSPEEAVETRRLVLLARATGAVVEGPGWTVASLPAARFAPRGLPRVLVVHPVDDDAEAARALAPFRAELGTVGTPGEHGIVGALGLGGLPPVRVCALGEMQRPPGGRPLHDGVDVMGWLWSR